MEGRTQKQEMLCDIWADILGIENIGLHDNFFDLGGDSFDVVRLLSQIQAEFGVAVSLEALIQAPTIKDLAALISGERSLESVPGVVPIQPVGSRPPFFCIGAGPLFRALALRLGSDQPFIGLGLGAEAIQSLPSSFTVKDITAPLIEKIRDIQPAGPYFLGGWCADGVIACELAQQLLHHGESVGLLVLFDVWNPAYVRESGMYESWGSRLNLLDRRMKFHLARLRCLRMKEKLAYIREGVEFRLRRLKLRTLEAFYRLHLAVSGRVDFTPRHFDMIEHLAVRNYRPEPYAGDVLLMKSELTALRRSRGHDMGWGQLLAGGLEVRDMPSGHKDMFREPNAEITARFLSECLLQTRGI